MSVPSQSPLITPLAPRIDPTTTSWNESQARSQESKISDTPQLGLVIRSPTPMVLDGYHTWTRTDTGGPPKRSHPSRPGRVPLRPLSISNHHHRHDRHRIPRHWPSRSRLGLPVVPGWQATPPIGTRQPTCDLTLVQTSRCSSTPPPPVGYYNGQTTRVHLSSRLFYRNLLVAMFVSNTLSLSGPPAITALIRSLPASPV